MDPLVKNLFVGTESSLPQIKAKVYAGSLNLVCIIYCFEKLITFYISFFKNLDMDLDCNL